MVAAKSSGLIVLGFGFFFSSEDERTSKMSGARGMKTPVERESRSSERRR